MLNTVPNATNKMLHSVITNHPNAFNCEIYRKVIDRENSQTLGGLGVLSSEDEENIRFEFVGIGYALQAENFQQSQMMDRQDTNNSYADEVRFVIAPENDDFVIEKHDVLYLLFMDGKAKLAWEIVGIETTVNIAPYTRRYVCNKRNDLDVYY